MVQKRNTNIKDQDRSNNLTIPVVGPQHPRRPRVTYTVEADVAALISVMRLEAARAALFVQRPHRGDGQRRDDGGNRICPRPPPRRPRSARCGRHRDSLVAAPIGYLLRLSFDG